MAKLMKLEVKKLLLFCVLLAFVCSCFYFLVEDSYNLSSALSHVEGDAIVFSQDTGCYNDTLTVTLRPDLEIPLSAKIYYTLDGDDPSVSGQEYRKGITLEAAEDQMRFYPLKAVIYYRGEYSAVAERTYVIGSGTVQFTMPMVSITSSQVSLYDPETGIFVHNSERGDEWVRDAHITMFNEAGSILLDQKVGLAVSGGTSARQLVRSLKVVADESYDPNHDKLELNFFGAETSASSYSYVEEYNSIRLRSGSQDTDYGNIRSSVLSRLAEESNFDGCTGTQRCAVYLNGLFYGIFDMQQNYSSSYLARRFGLSSSSDVFKLKGAEQDVFTAVGVADYFDLDLNVPENRALLEQAVDMDNYLLYYAISILVNNTDWPGNNFEVWKSVGAYDPDNPYSDGRIRFLLYDSDLIYFTEGNELWFEDCISDTFVSLMEGNVRGVGSTFPKVMQSDYYRDKFLTVVSDLRNTSFATERVLEIVDEEWTIVYQEYLNQKGAAYTHEMAEYVELMKSAVQQREIDLDADFAAYFQRKETYPVTICNTGAVSLSWNQMELYQGETYENSYYYGVEFTLEATAYPGHQFCYWTVNGEPIYGESLTLSDALLQQEERLVVETVTRPLEGPCLILSELSAKQGTDWMRVTNVGQESVALDRYYLSDDAGNLRMFQLPAVTLAPNQSIVINGKRNYYAVGDYICNFSLNEEEVLYLTDGTAVMDRMAVPRMSKQESYGRYYNSTVMKYFLNPTEERKSVS